MIAVNAINPLTISVGKFGTAPIRKNLYKIGINKIAENTNNAEESTEKKLIGLKFLYNFTIVLSTFTPSE